ncbi:RNA polymerase-associated protein RTF1 [Rhizoctonia solani AG-1 IB]|uniref:RNA polymerase-associated protein RTF1 n=1 Tax=Thanatephorus cucumeris (strain AG1-IB / isolate 7/3/14) TaxID=1108050 RepID=M5BKD8_THACB|nr:RNA polymerase-associated protein RTF1 [Rhizoctonia solani AG-1 IB]
MSTITTCPTSCWRWLELGIQRTNHAAANVLRLANTNHLQNAGSTSQAEDEYADDPESEEDEANPYPLEGKYADELDRQRLLEMPETEREDILSQRMEEMQRFQDKVNLDRKHTSIGATKEKSKGLEQLKEKRRAKQDNMSRRTRTSPDDSPVKRRSSSPESDSSDEEGQFRPGDESFDNSTPRQKKEEKEEPPAIDDFNAELVQGAYVRYLTGADEHGAPIYRACEIVGWYSLLSL